VTVTRDSQGQPDSLSVVVLDITHRKAAEVAVRESQSYLRLILDSSADPFYCNDCEGNTTLCNLAFLETLGFESDAEVIGRNIHGIIHHSQPDGSHYQYEECLIYRCARTGSSQHISNELFFRKDGSSFPVEYSVRPIVRDGVRQGAICTFRDIAEERKAAERQALLIQELNQRVKNLLLNTSTLLNAFGDMEAKFVGKAVVITDGKAGTVENVWLDEHHRLLISIRGHDGK
jgi:PAS domain S-box-containing protein